jgi:hypothetical protein
MIDFEIFNKYDISSLEDMLKFTNKMEKKDKEKWTNEEKQVYIMVTVVLSIPVAEIDAFLLGCGFIATTIPALKASNFIEQTEYMGAVMEVDQILRLCATLQHKAWNRHKEKEKKNKGKR